MSVGTAWTPEGVTGLWNLKFKINGPYHGFTENFHLAEKTEDEAVTIGTDLGKKLKAVLPGDCEIFYATVSKSDRRRDSRFVPDVIGVGQHLLSAGPDVPATVNHESDALRVRFESAGPGPVVRKFPCVPDVEIEGQLLANVITPVSVFPPSNPTVPVAFLDWAANMLTYMKTIVYSTHHVLTIDEPGGVYTYYAWKKAYPGAVSTKKGGRDFT